MPKYLTDTMMGNAFVSAARRWIKPF